MARQGVAGLDHVLAVPEVAVDDQQSIDHRDFQDGAWFTSSYTNGGQNTCVEVNYSIRGT